MMGRESVGEGKGDGMVGQEGLGSRRGLGGEGKGEGQGKGLEE